MSEDELKDRDLRVPLLVPCLLVIVIFLYGHLAMAPQMDFVLDDWTNFYISNAHGSWGKAMQVALEGHVTRPITMMYTYTVYRLMGADFTGYWFLSACANAVNVVLLMLIVHRLTNEKRTALLAGLVFSLIPTISENINWCTMVISAASCAIPLFLASTLCWVHFVQKRLIRWGVASAIFYAFGIFGYEIGAFLPLAFAVLLRKDTFSRALFVVGAVFGGLGMFYAGWRLTQGFGLVESKTLGSQFAIDPAAILVNAKNLLHWWVGDYFWGAVLTGYEGFNTFDLWTRRVVMVCNVGVSVLVGRILYKNFRNRDTSSRSLFSNSNFWFGVIWIMATHAPSLISYTASRLNYLPAVGVSLVVAVMLRRLDAKVWTGVFGLATFALITANQGMNKNWSDAGVLNRRIYAHLEEHHENWKDKAVVWYDTRRLAERQAKGLLLDPQYDLRSVAFNGHPEQAGLLRGFGLFGMQELLKQQRHAPQVVLDVECRPSVEEEMLLFHLPHRPDEKREQPISEVFVVNIGDLIGK